MSRRENHLALASIQKLRERRHVGVRSTALFPNRTRLYDRHRDFERAGVVHLFADDVADLVQTPPSERHDVEDARRDLLDETGTRQILVADRLSLNWCFTRRLDVILRCSHRDDVIPRGVSAIELPRRRCSNASRRSDRPFR